MSVDLRSDEYIRDLVAHLPGVAGAVWAKGQAIGKTAQSRLEMHRFYGDDSQSEIEMERRYPDALVSLVDEAAGAIEFGSRRPNGRFVHGLYIVTGAAGLA